MAQADVDEGKREGLSSDEKAKLVRLRRENRTQAMEIEILKRASAYIVSLSGRSAHLDGTRTSWLPSHWSNTPVA